jgi:hypothetical protein
MSNDSFRRAVTRTPNSDTITLSGRLSGAGDYLGSYDSSSVLLRITQKPNCRISRHVRRAIIAASR